MENLAQRINTKAREFGAHLCGTANLKDLKDSPSHRISPNLPAFSGVGTRETENGPRGVVQWPEGARSAIVLALAHPRENPELDDWVTRANGVGNTAGNRILMAAVSKLAAWLETDLGLLCLKLPYHIEHGGVFMKDAAVLAGLGCIGRNNLLVTPEFGPRVRLRVMLTDADLPSQGPGSFDPCKGCPVPCRAACPQQAFTKKIYRPDHYGQKALPGRNGVYDRFTCNVQMVADQSRAKLTGPPEDGETRVPYCRQCELACIAGTGQAPV